MNERRRSITTTESTRGVSSADRLIWHVDECGGVSLTCQCQCEEETSDQMADCFTMHQYILRCIPLGGSCFHILVQFMTMCDT